MFDDPNLYDFEAALEHLSGYIWKESSGSITKNSTARTGDATPHTLTRSTPSARSSGSPTTRPTSRL